MMTTLPWALRFWRNNPWLHKFRVLGWTLNSLHLDMKDFVLGLFGGVPVDPSYSCTAFTSIWGFDSSYSTARSTSTTYSDKYPRVGQFSYYYVLRSFLRFDTTSLPSSATILQVNLVMACQYDYSDADFDVQIVRQAWAYPVSSSNQEANYDGCLSGTADQSIWRNTYGMRTNTYYASGNLSTSWPVKGGYTHYSLRSNRDYAGIPPSQSETIVLHTTSYPPYLSITYSVSKLSRLLTWVGW